MTGDLLPAEEAKEVGLVNHVVSPSELDDKVDEIVEKIASNPKYAVQGNKMLLNKWIEFWSDNMRTEAAAVGVLHQQLEDHDDYVSDFLND
jgi:enoyl-CoA hydratase/carnithine racemase